MRLWGVSVYILAWSLHHAGLVHADVGTWCRGDNCVCDTWCNNIITQGAQAWMADFNNVSRPGSIDYNAEAEGRARFAQGLWTFFDFNVPARGTAPEQTQLVYSSPMGRTCVRNLTIHLSGGMEQCTRAFGPTWNRGSWHLLNCTMHAAAWATRTVDLLNSGTAMPGVCLQVSITPFDGPMSTAVERRKEVSTATHQGPPKQALIVSAFDGDMATEDAVLMNSLAVPALYVSPNTGGAEMFYDRTKYPLTVQFWPRWRDSALLVLLQGAPKRVAFLRQDNQICNSAAQTLLPMAAAKGIDVVQEIIQYNADPGMQSSNWPPVAQAIARLKAANRRYMWYCGDSALLAVLLCESRHADYIGPHVQWHAIGSLAFTALATTAPVVNCTREDMVLASESGGFVWAMYTTGFSFLPYLDQMLVPVAEQAIDMTGEPWPEDGSRALVVQPTAACHDDEVALNVAADKVPRNGLRTLLRGRPMGGLTCDDLVVGGFCDAPLGLATAAQFCPISCCADNRYSYACRISCACNEPPEVTDMRGNALCVNETWRLPEGWFSRPQQEVKSWSPRQLFTLPPNKTQWSASVEAIAYGTSEPRASQFGDAARNGITLFNPCYYSDALVAWYLAFRCMADRYGVASWTSVAKSNLTVATQVVDVCLQRVDFHGFSGQVRFDGNGRSLATAFMDTWNGRLSNQALKTDPQGKPFVGGIYNFLEGVVVNNTYVSALRDYGRNVSACHGQGNRALALDLCPGKENSFFWHWTQRDLSQNVPLDGPSTCPPGFYTLAVGEPAEAMAVDTCAPCPVGTAKEVSGSMRCRGCAAGFYQSATGMSACLACPPGTISSPPVSVHVGRYAEEQTLGAPACTGCPMGTMAELASSTRCTPCSPGTAAGNVGSAQCVRCPKGQFQADSSSTACDLCPEGRSTLGLGATCGSECVCPRNSLLLSSGSCASCNPTQAFCPGGEEEMDIFSMPRYYFPSVSMGGLNVTDGDLLAPLEVPLPYLCRDNVACPGNMRPGECPEGHAGVACGQCLFGFVRSSRGCIRCRKPMSDKTAGAGLLTLGVIVSCGVMLASYPILNAPETAYTSTVRYFALSLGCAVNAAMVLALLSRLPSQWPATLATPQGAFKVLFFDSDVFRLGCFVQQTPLDHVYVKFWVPITIVGAYLLCSCFACVPGLRWIEMDKLLNCIGYFVSGCFLPLAMNALEIFNCYSHPAPNTQLSVVTMPDVLCFDNYWVSTLLPWGLLSLMIYPCGLGVLILYLTVRAPHLTRSHPRWQTRLKCLYTRFRYTCWWWGLVLITRDASLSILTAIVAGNAYAQSLLIVLVLLVYQQMLLLFRPWRTDLQMLLDAALVFLLTVVAVCGSCFAEQPPAPLLDEAGRDTPEWRAVYGILESAVPLGGIACFAALVIGVWLGRGDIDRHERAAQELLAALQVLGSRLQDHQVTEDKLLDNAFSLLAPDLSHLHSSIRSTLQEVVGAGEGYDCHASCGWRIVVSSSRLKSPTSSPKTSAWSEVLPTSSKRRDSRHAWAADGQQPPAFAARPMPPAESSTIFTTQPLDIGDDVDDFELN